MKTYSINALLCRQKSLKQRKSELESIRNNTTTRTSYRDMNGNERTDTPLYDIKKVDKRIVGINNALLTIDEEIKASNARTMLEVNIDFDTLMSAVED